ncbi:hypothetical protein [Paenibacillus radicis (ex Xue et al. 2023)]|uniref:DUF1648 domain-containing protein n=1 Tax=Paenibacillus radicis (ex Xue et al. 2023) TaxID=2972489 RepID=A0ABT1YIJ9_9BACL|nr:hypothetical protein [Paenibacillus radicis (ex Xue et al. 2023)]MCR8632083.1 hypothetical protein [Paenibacillus radicis (ex Xue et al. 2023)]
MFAKQPNMSLYLLAVSIVIVLYLIFVVIPYGEQYHFFSEGGDPQEDKILPYFLMTTPILTGYLILVVINFKKVIYLCCLNYPLIIFNIYVFSFMCFSVIGGAVLWLMVFTALIPLILVPVSFVLGLIKDIKYSKKDY